MWGFFFGGGGGGELSVGGCNMMVLCTHEMYPLWNPLQWISLDYIFEIGVPVSVHDVDVI